MKLYCAILILALGVLFSPAPHAQSGSKTKTTWSSDSGPRKYDFAIVSRDGNVENWGDMGSFNSDSLRARTKEDTLYVRKDGQLYAITDRGTLLQTRAAMEPVEKLGMQMGELGKQQGQVGKEQGKIGAQQGELGRQMGELGRRLGEEARNGESTAATSAKMKTLGEQMKALGRQMSEAGDKQKPYGKEMGELGHQMGVSVREAEAKITKLIDDAFARGLAHKV